MDKIMEFIAKPTEALIVYAAVIVFVIAIFVGDNSAMHDYCMELFTAFAG